MPVRGKLVLVSASEYSSFSSALFNLSRKVDKALATVGPAGQTPSWPPSRAVSANSPQHQQLLVALTLRYKPWSLGAAQ